MPFEPLDIPTDPDEVTGRILDDLQDKVPGWAPVEGALDTALAEEIGQETATVATYVRDGAALAAAGVGETVFGFPANLGTTATLPVQLEVSAVGVVVPAGFMVAGLNAVGEEVAFELLTDHTAATTTPSVTMTATTPGTIGNGVPAGEVAILTATATVLTATATGPSAGGTDDEALTTYLGRLIEYLSVLRPGGVRAEDLAALARSVPGVARALGVDLYDALSDTDGVERTATVFVVDAAGAPVGAGVKADVYDELEAVREPNFVLYVADATYTPVDVVYSVTADAGASPATVATAIETAVLAYLSPAAWGTTDDDPTVWQQRTTIRLLDIATVIGSVDGVASVATVTLNGAAADVTLTGRAPLPATVAGGTSVTGTVS